MLTSKMEKGLLIPIPNYTKKESKFFYIFKVWMLAIFFLKLLKLYSSAWAQELKSLVAFDVKIKRGVIGTRGETA